MSIKPIETYYKGYRFRSRTEARWAVFFDSMGIKYQYELEGYNLGDGLYYLPDFYLPDAKQFFEVKPDVKNIPEVEKEKIHRLANGTDKYVIVGDSDFNVIGCEPDGVDYDGAIIKVGFDVCDTHLVRCCKCGKLYFENEMSYYCTACDYYDGDSTFNYVDYSGYGCDYEYEKYKQALINAKSARFEHGEMPCTTTKRETQIDWDELFV